MRAIISCVKQAQDATLDVISSRDGIDTHVRQLHQEINTAIDSAIQHHGDKEQELMTREAELNKIEQQ